MQPGYLPKGTTCSARDDPAITRARQHTVERCRFFWAVRVRMWGREKELCRGKATTTMLCDRAHLLLISCDHPIQIQASARPAQHGIQSLNSFPKKNNKSGNNIIVIQYELVCIYILKEAWLYRESRGRCSRCSKRRRQAGCFDPNLISLVVAYNERIKTSKQVPFNCSYIPYAVYPPFSQPNQCCGCTSRINWGFSISCRRPIHFPINRLAESGVH